MTFLIIAASQSLPHDFTTGGNRQWSANRLLFMPVDRVSSATTDPRAKGAHPSDFFDASIINKLRKEGFVKSLWASK